MSGQSHDGLALHRLAGVLPPPLAFANASRGLEPIHDRHLTVHEHQVVSLPVQTVERLLAVIGDLHRTAELREHGLGDFLVHQVIFDQQNAGVPPRGRRSAGVGRRGSLRRARIIRTVQAQRKFEGGTLSLGAAHDQRATHHLHQLSGDG